jgi:RimJ/RimL family protein N-acetyltransferase
MDLDTPVLFGRYVALEPLSDRHESELRQAADDPAIWPYLPVPGAGEGFDAWWRDAIDAREARGDVVFAVRLRERGRVVGSTRYLNIVAEHGRLEIGYTWYERVAWGGMVNPECKLLLMTHAFEQWRFNRVEFRCDSRNTRSWQAIKRLGAVEEGILRHHMVVQHGHVRDTVQFSVLAGEWVNVKAGLEARLHG